jgi:SAM-dependent methyltransferase
LATFSSMAADQGPDSGWEFYSDPEAVHEYITYRDEGQSRNALIEEPTFLSMLGEVRGLDCLDLGCGYGYYSELAASMGARVTAIDRAPLMIDEAKRRTKAAVDYSVVDIEEAEFPPDNFDVVFSNLAFHYIDDIHSLFRRVFRWIRGGGRFVFSVEHPIYTAAKDLDQWADAEHSRWIVSDYFREGERWGPFGRRYHHTFQTWTGAGMTAGFLVTDIREPEALPSAHVTTPSLSEDENRPLMLLLSYRKPSS